MQMRISLFCVKLSVALLTASGEECNFFSVTLLYVSVTPHLALYFAGICLRPSPKNHALTMYKARRLDCQV